MHQVPALVLDCDADIDVVNDVEAKTEYAQKVRPLLFESCCFYFVPG